MGILDDAIRQHLDLKRRLGAEDAEIQRLEDEAFGPPTRPGEPDFPETGEAAQVPPDTGENAQVVSERAPEAEPVQEPAEPAGASFYDHSESDASADPAPAELTPEPAEEPLAEAPFEMELPPIEGLDPDMSEAGAGAGAESVAAEPAERPIESFDTVEHHFEGAVEETATPELAEAEVVEGEVDGSQEQLPSDGDEDVLEETPEFLRDQPEDDELWFEQGEPKDFDF